MTTTIIPPPLTAEGAATWLVRALLGPDERWAGCLMVVICSGVTPLQPCIVDELPPEAPDDAELLFRPFVDVCRDVPEPGLLAVVARRGGLSPRPSDQRWHDAFVAACAGQVRIVGVWLATPTGERPLP